MEDPPAEPRIVEVVATPTNPPITGQSNAATGNSTLTSTGSKKQDSELQPLKSGNLTDLDEQMEGTYKEIYLIITLYSLIYCGNISNVCVFIT